MLLYLHFICIIDCVSVCVCVLGDMSIGACVGVRGQLLKLFHSIYCEFHALNSGSQAWIYTEINNQLLRLAMMHTNSINDQK